MKKITTLFALLFSFCAFAQLPVIQWNAQSSGGGLSGSLVAAWTMDEDIASGTRADSVGSNPLTDVNSNTGRLRGLMGGSASFTNSPARILTHADNATLGAGAGVSFTLSFWVSCMGINNGWVGKTTSDGATFDYKYDVQAGTFTVKDLSATSRSVTIAIPGNSTALNQPFHHVVCGYDNANGVMFLQLDNSARSTLAISGVQESAVAFNCALNLSLLDEMYLWKRALTTAEVTQLYNSSRGLKWPFTYDNGTQIAQTWGWALTNAGAAYSVTESNAMRVLGNASVADGTWDKISVLVPFTTNSLTTALMSVKPIYHITGGNSFVYNIVTPEQSPVSFVGWGTDLTINGLTGNGTSKYTKINNSAQGAYLPNVVPNFNEAGFTIYCYTATSSAHGAELGGLDDGQTPLQGMFYFRINSESATTTIGVIGDDNIGCSTNVPNPGYFSVQRASTTDISMYFAQSTFPHGLVQQTTTANGVSATRTIDFTLFTLTLDGGPTTLNCSPNTLSFFTIESTHFSSADDANFYNDVQAFRTAIGGGFR